MPGAHADAERGARPLGHCAAQVGRRGPSAGKMPPYASLQSKSQDNTVTTRLRRMFVLASKSSTAMRTPPELQKTRAAEEFGRSQ